MRSARFMRAAMLPAIVLGLIVLGCGADLATRFSLHPPSRPERAFVTRPAVRVQEGPHPGTEYTVVVRPKVIPIGLGGSSVEIQLVRRGFDFEFNPAADTFYFRKHGATGGRVLRPTGLTGPSSGCLAGTIGALDANMVGYWDLVIRCGGLESEPIPFALRVVDKLRVALTFDDGPSIEPDDRTSPTARILDCLEEDGIKAAFFVLSSEDHVLYMAFEKAERIEGLRLLKRAALEGHVLACHWGGGYESQTRLHPSRVCVAADIANPFVGDGSALASDLDDCQQRILQAQEPFDLSFAPDLVRPPCWVYRKGSVDARPTYESLGLKMVLTDSLLHDGGYWFLVPLPMACMRRWMLSGLKAALAEGHADVVLTMHDSNCRTARGLGRTIEAIREKMERLGYIEEVHWEFVKDTGELLRILRRKQRFHSEPDTLVPDISGGGTR